MIAKKYRLSERDIRKVFLKKKPFFSYLFVANVRPNSLWYARVALMLSAKVAKWSVNRNLFRRKFYDISPIILDYGLDIVFCPKKGTKFSHKNMADQENFTQNISFIYQKIISDFYAANKTP